MASSNDNVSMALFCDFENVALGVRDANYDKFDIKPVLERLLLKGNIVVKKAYCDWDRYKAFKAPMHEANFELIEIPHVRQSGKNSADIRMVVDALDMCYTKSHVDTFVIISGDSDFSPLVSKLRENAKKVIGVGVKQSTSDLLVANCDEFIFYDDLVRESRRAKRDAGEATKPAVKRSPEEERGRRDEMDKRRNQAVEIAVNTFEALVLERGDSGKIWASVLKEAIKRRKPDFSESYYGFRTFGNLIEECKARGLLEFGRDEKSGAYVYRSSGASSGAPQGGNDPQNGDNAGNEVQEGGKQESRRSRGRGRTAAERFAERQAERLAQQAGNADADTDANVDNEDGDDAETPVYSGPYHVFAKSQSEPDAQPEAQPESQPTPAPESDRNRGRGRGNRGGRKQGERQGGQAAIAAAEASVATETAIDSPDQPDQPNVVEARDEARVDPRNKPRGKARNNARNNTADVAGGEARNDAREEAGNEAGNEAPDAARNNAPDEARNETATAAPGSDEAPVQGKKKSGPKPPARKVKAAAKPAAEEAKAARDGRGRNAAADAEQAATTSPDAPAAAPAAAAAPAPAPAPARAPAPRPASQAFDVNAAAAAAAAEPAEAEAEAEPAAAKPAKPKAAAKPRKPATRTPRPAKAVAGSDE